MLDEIHELEKEITEEKERERKEERELGERVGAEKEREHLGERAGAERREASELTHSRQHPVPHYDPTSHYIFCEKTPTSKKYILMCSTDLFLKFSEKLCSDKNAPKCSVVRAPYQSLA